MHTVVELIRGPHNEIKDIVEAKLLLPRMLLSHLTSKMPSLTCFCPILEKNKQSYIFMNWVLLVFKTVYITATSTKIPLGVLMLGLTMACRMY